MPALPACTSRTVYFSFPENVQPAPSPASSQTPRNGSSSSLSSMSGSHGDRRRVSCTFCRMPLCGEFIMCKEREEKSQKKVPAPRYGSAEVDRPRCFNCNGWSIQRPTAGVRNKKLERIKSSCCVSIGTHALSPFISVFLSLSFSLCYLLLIHSSFFTGLEVCGVLV